MEDSLNNSPVITTHAIRILLGTTGRAPYGETAPADIHTTFNAAVLGSLLTISASFELVPNLIQRWSWDTLTHSYLLTLRDDIFFHNGRSATASDLEFTILRGFFTQHRSFYNMYLQNIEGLDAIKVGSPFRSGVVSGVQIEGPLSVRVTLKTPSTTFLFALARSYFSLVAQETLQSDYVSWKDVPIGAGPYRVVTPFENGKISLELVHSDLSTAPQWIDLYTADEGGNFDIRLLEPLHQSETSYVTEYTKYPDSIWTIFFSYVHPLGQQLAFRQAIQHAINRKALAQGMEEQSVPAYELLPRHFWGRADTADTYNPAKARALLQSVPHKLLAQEWLVPVFAGPTFSPEKARLLERVRIQLNALGIRVRFTPNGEKFISHATASKVPMTISGRITNYVEPHLMFASFHNGSPYQFERPQIRSARFEKLFSDAEAANDKESRVQSMRALSVYANEVVLAVPLLEQKNVFYYNPATIASLGEQPDPLYLQLERVVPTE